MALLRRLEVPEKAFYKPVGFLQMVEGRSCTTMQTFADSTHLS